MIRRSSKMADDFEPTNDTLQFAAMMIRHAERGPGFIHPDDPNKDLWPNGANNLTALGKKQSFEIGQQLRERYDGFLSTNYRPEEVYVRSTDTDRCLVTAQGCMAGLFPAKGTDIWEAANPWQPVPIHTVPEKLDPCSLKCGGFVEPKLPHLRPEVYQHVQRHKDFFDKFTKASGFTSSDSLFDRLGILNSLVIEKQLGLLTPHDCGFSLEDMYAVAKEMYILQMTDFMGISVPAAETLDVLLDAMKNKVEGKTPLLKSYFFFTHDFIIGCVMSAMTGKSENPGFVAMLLFELHKHHKTGEYYIRAIYKGGLKKDQSDVTLPGFERMCPFDDFITSLKSFIMYQKL